MYTIRRGMHQDCPGIAALLMPWKPSRAREFSGDDAELPFYDVCYLVITDSEGQVVGFLEGMLDSHYDKSIAPPALAMPQAFVQTMCVAVEQRGKGFGAALLRRFAQEAAAVGLTYLATTADQGGGQDRRVKFFLGCGLASLDQENPLWAFGAPVAQLVGDGPMPDLRWRTTL